MLKPGLLRFLLATLVVLFHVTRFAFLGRFAVCSFFILSGYWITLMYKRKYQLKAAPLKTFYVSRAWRIYPVFYAFALIGLFVSISMKLHLVMAVSALPAFDKVTFICAHVLLITYYSLPKFNLLTPAWSLDIELQFYLLFPLLFILLKRRAGLLLMLTAVLSLISFFIMQYFASPWVSNSLLVYLHFFIIGMLTQHYNLTFTSLVEKAAICVFCLAIALQYIIPYAILNYKNEASLYYQIMSFSLTLIFLPVIANSVHRFSSQNDRLLGNLSFLVYLSHWVCLKPYVMLSAGTGTMVHLIYFAGYMAATFLLALLVYKLIDRPFERRRHEWVHQQL